MTSNSQSHEHQQDDTELQKNTQTHIDKHILRWYRKPVNIIVDKSEL